MYCNKKKIFKNLVVIAYHVLLNLNRRKSELSFLTLVFSSSSLSIFLLVSFLKQDVSHKPIFIQVSLATQTVIRVGSCNG